MNFLRKLFGKSEPTPSVFEIEYPQALLQDHLSEYEFKEMIDRFRNEALTLGFSLAPLPAEPGAALAYNMGSAEDEPMELHFGRFAKEYAETDATDRDDLVRHFAKTMLATEAPSVDTWEHAASCLCFRAYSADVLDKLAEQGIAHERFLADCALMLSLDLPGMYQSVNHDDLARWGVDYDTARQAAFQNMMRPGTAQVAAPESGPQLFALLFLDNFAAATAMAFIERIPVTPGRLGTLIAVPSIHCVAYFPLEGPATEEVVNNWGNLLSEQFFSQHSFSANLFWLKPDGSFDLIPAQQGLNRQLYYDLQAFLPQE